MEDREIEMKRFYADEDFARPVVVALRLLGHDVLTVLEDGRANQEIPDDQVLKRATELERAVLSRNRRDFARLHTMQPEHMGIVLCKHETDFGGQANRIEDAVKPFANLKGQLIRVQKPAEQRSK